MDDELWLCHGAALICMRAALRVMPPILLCWPTTSEANAGGMAVHTESSHQYSITCRCHVTDGSRGVVWHNGAWHGSAYEAKVRHWIPPRGKMAPIDIHQHLLNIYGDQKVDESTVRDGWSVSAVATEIWKTDYILEGHTDFYKLGMQLLLISGENAELMVVTMLKNSIL